MHVTSEGIHFKTSLSHWVSEQSSALVNSVTGQWAVTGIIFSQFRQYSITRRKLACPLLSILVMPNQGLGECSTLCPEETRWWPGSALSGLCNSSQCLFTAFIYLFIYCMGDKYTAHADTEGRTLQKNSCNIHGVDKNVFGLEFLWFNQQGSKGWNTRTAPLLLAKEIDAKAISQSRPGKSQEQWFFS